MDYYIIHYVVSGFGSLVLDGRLYKIKKNQAFIIPPDTSYFYQADEFDPWEYIWINFNGAHAAQLLNLKSPVANIDYDYFKDMKSCTEYVGQEADYLAGKLFLIIAQLTRKPQISNYIHMAKTYMETYYAQDISINEMAATIGLDRKYLARIFKKHTNMSMSDFLFDIRMRKASAAISDGEKRVSVISSMVGYDDPLFFSRQFKKYFGLSPSEFIMQKNKDI